MDDVRDVNADYDERAIALRRPAASAAGVPAVLVALRRSVARAVGEVAHLPEALPLPLPC